jgi:peptidoglycan/LPS O-acetylase OafA/YrhL
MADGMDRPRIAHQPALDGVRAVSVLAVLLFHAEIGGFDGGYLGVSVFFTLSGFLITTLARSSSSCPFGHRIACRSVLRAVV